jgi:hypothetical protein
MNVLGHDDVPINAHLEATAHFLQAFQKQIAFFDGSKAGLAAVTTASYRVRLPGLLKTPKTAWREAQLHRAVTEVKGRPEPALRVPHALSEVEGAGFARVGFLSTARPSRSG